LTRERLGSFSEIKNWASFFFYQSITAEWEKSDDERGSLTEMADRSNQQASKFSNQ